MKKKCLAHVARYMLIKRLRGIITMQILFFVFVKNEKPDTGIEWSVVYVSLRVWQKLLEKSRSLVGHE